MIDFTKLLCEDQNIIERLYTYCINNLQLHKPQNNNYTCFSNESSLFRLEFRKVLLGGNVIGYRHVEICFSPHYIYNNYLHNGNDFTPEDCITTVQNIFATLELAQPELELLRVVGIEFGVNIQLRSKVEDVISGFRYYKKRAFTTKYPSLPHYKVSGTAKYKQFKVYAKGLQFTDYPEYGISRNTLRLEIKSKQAKNISKYGIFTANDLLATSTYSRLSQELLNELDFIFIVNLFPNLSSLTADESEFITTIINSDFSKESNGVTFSRLKQKYYRLLGSDNNLHFHIKSLVIDKLFYFQSVTFSTQENHSSVDMCINEEDAIGINVENVTSSRNNSEILPDGIDVRLLKPRLLPAHYIPP